MSSGRGERALAARGSKRPLGESTSNRDVTEMKSRNQCPLGTGKIAVNAPSVNEEASTPPPRPGTSQDRRKVYIRSEKFAGSTLGPTRAMIDMRKQRLRRNRAEKQQSLNSARKEAEKLYAGVNQMFEELESTLLTHPAHPSMHVQTASVEFNVKSRQLQDLQKKMSVIKNELQLIDQMLNRRKDPVFPRQKKNICTTSRQFSRKESNPSPEVCGFPIHENMYHQLSIQESHNEGNVSEIPVEVADSNEADMQLLDPRRKRTQNLQSECSKSWSSIAEPVNTIQSVTDSVLKTQISNMTEQAIELQKNVPDQQDLQNLNQSVLRVSSTVKSEHQSSVQSARSSAGQLGQMDAASSAHSGAYQAVNTAAVSTAYKDARVQGNIPLIMPTVELKPRSPPTFYGNFREDVSRWISYMGNYLTFVQGTPDQQVNFAVTYIRGPALEWWDKYTKEYGYPSNWTELSKALKGRFGSPYRAAEAQAKIIHIQQGKRKVREYSNEFLTLLNRLISYDESFMVNIYIWGLQPHFAKYVSAYCPETVSKAIKIAEETEFSIWASQKDHLTKSHNGRQPTKQKKSRASKDDHQQQEQQQQKREEQHQYSFEDCGQ